MDYGIGLARNSRLVETIGWELADAQAEAKRRGRPARRFKSSSTPHSQAGPASAGSSPRPSTCRQGQPALRGSPRCPTPSRPGPSTSASTARGATWRTRSRSSSSISSPTGPRRRASPPTSSGSSSPPSPRPLRCAQACAARHPPGPRHRRNAAAQAPQDRRPRHGSVRRVKVAMDSAHPSAAAFARVHARLPG